MKLSIVPALPRVCHRCKTKLPEKGSVCVNCGVEQREVLMESLLRYVLIVVLVLTLALPLGWAIYHFA